VTFLDGASIADTPQWRHLVFIGVLTDDLSAAAAQNIVSTLFQHGVFLYLCGECEHEKNLNAVLLKNYRSHDHC